ncbi:hypothetical protein ABZT08_13590 [Streptomyces sp. NPDC005526]|uniref:hypothetical protein n=1 Tax=Streptomyces sp. NPDC005526 TaxID=3156885 RepID=UPI0033A757FC
MAFDLAHRGDVQTDWPYAWRRAVEASFADRGLAAPFTLTRGWPAWTAAALAVHLQTTVTKAMWSHQAGAHR